MQNEIHMTFRKESIIVELINECHIIIIFNLHIDTIHQPDDDGK